MITEVLCGVIDQIAEGQTVNPDDKQFIAEFLSYGVSGSVTNWVKTGMKQRPEDTVRHLQEVVNGFKSFVVAKYLPK